MSTTALRVLTETVHHELPMPAISYGIMAMVAFLLLLGVLFAFRNTHQKYAPPTHGHGAHGQVGHAERAGIADSHSPSQHGH